MTEHLGHRVRQLYPGFLLHFEPLASALGQLVIFGAPVIFGNAPTSLDPAAPLQPMERGIQRSLLDTQHVVGNLLDALRYRPAMLSFQDQRLQNEYV